MSFTNFGSQTDYNRFKSTYIKNNLDISGTLILRKNTKLYANDFNSYDLSGNLNFYNYSYINFNDVLDIYIKNISLTNRLNQILLNQANISLIQSNFLLDISNNLIIGSNANQINFLDNFIINENNIICNKNFINNNSCLFNSTGIKSNIMQWSLNNTYIALLYASILENQFNFKINSNYLTSFYFTGGPIYCNDLLYINDYDVYNNLLTISGNINTLQTQMITNINNITDLETSVTNLSINDTNLQLNINTVQNNLQTQINNIINDTNFSHLTIESIEITNDLINPSLCYIDMKTTNSDYDVRLKQQYGISSKVGRGLLNIEANVLNLENCGFKTLTQINNINVISSNTICDTMTFIGISSWKTIHTFNIQSNYKRKIFYTMPIYFSSSGGAPSPPNSYSFSLTFNNLQIRILKDGLLNSTISDFYFNDTLPITKNYSYYNDPASMIQYVTNVNFYFNVDNDFYTDSIYQIQFYSTNSLYVNNTISTYTATNTSILSSSGSNYKVASYSESNIQTDINSTSGSVEMNHIFVNELTCNSYFQGYYQPRYSSDWFSITSNSNYTITLSFSYTLDSLPIYKILFSLTNTPSFSDVYDITGYNINYSWTNGYYIKYLSTNQIQIRTGNVVGLYYNSSNVNQQATSGYYKVIIY